MKMNIPLVLIAASLMVGCGDKSPKCNSDDAKNLVVDIVRKTIEKGMTLEKDVQISVENVRTVSHEPGLMFISVRLIWHSQNQELNNHSQ